MATQQTERVVLSSLNSLNLSKTDLAYRVTDSFLAEHSEHTTHFLFPLVPPHNQSASYTWGDCLKEPIRSRKHMQGLTCWGILSNRPDFLFYNEIFSRSDGRICTAMLLLCLNSGAFIIFLLFYYFHFYLRVHSIFCNYASHCRVDNLLPVYTCTHTWPVYMNGHVMCDHRFVMEICSETELKLCRQAVENQCGCTLPPLSKTLWTQWGYKAVKECRVVNPPWFHHHKWFPHITQSFD